MIILCAMIWHEHRQTDGQAGPSVSFRDTEYIDTYIHVSFLHARLCRRHVLLVVKRPRRGPPGQRADGGDVAVDELLLLVRLPVPSAATTAAAAAVAIERGPGEVRLARRRHLGSPAEGGVAEVRLALAGVDAARGGEGAVVAGQDGGGDVRGQGGAEGVPVRRYLVGEEGVARQRGEYAKGDADFIFRRS